MGEYYYFVASLPMLWPGQAPPLKTDEFLEACERLLKPPDFRAIRKAKLNAPTLVATEIGLLKRYQEAELGLRNELVRLRAKKLNVEQDRYLRRESLNAVWASPAREIVEQETPLKAEQLLHRILWRVLDDLTAGHYFDLDLLTAYFLKLQILERNQLFDPDMGQSKLESILAGDKKDG